MENKKEIRKQMKAYRAGLKTEKKKQMDQAILTHFFEIERVQNAQHFFVYTSFGTEIDTISLILRSNACIPSAIASPITTGKIARTFAKS